MSALERFLHATDDGLPVLLRAGLAHVQFQTIHPFLDGNGRVGRLLITLLLCHAGLLSQPLLYLSLYFKQHRGDYYDLLNHVRRTGDWEAWIGFFLEGVKRTAEGAVSSAQRLSQMFQDDRNRIQVSGGRKTGSALRVHDALKARPILSLPVASRDAKLSFRAAASAMELLATHGVAREITGKRRNRLFVYDRYLSVLNEEAEVLPGTSVYNRSAGAIEMLNRMKLENFKAWREADLTLGKRHLNFSGTPGVGDTFFKHVFNYQYRSDRVRRVCYHPFGGRGEALKSCLKIGWTGQTASSWRLPSSRMLSF